MKLKLSFLALFTLLAISAKGAVVDTLAVYSEAMKKNVQVVVVSPENNRVPKPVIYLLHGYGGNAKTWISMKPELKDFADRDGLIFVCPDGKNSWYWDSPKDPSYRYETFTRQSCRSTVSKTASWILYSIAVTAISFSK